MTPAVPISEEVARTETDRWTHRVATHLPAELADVWLNDFPKGLTAADEMSLRLPILEAFAERLAMIPTPTCTPFVRARRRWWERAGEAIVRGMAAHSDAQTWRRGR